MWQGMRLDKDGLNEHITVQADINSDLSKIYKCCPTNIFYAT